MPQGHAVNKMKDEKKKFASGVKKNKDRIELE
jgi:hypothetical protein